MKVRRKRNSNDLSDLTPSSLARSRPWTNNNAPTQLATKPLQLQTKPDEESTNLLSRISLERSPDLPSPPESQPQSPVQQVFRKLTTQTDDSRSVPLAAKPFWLQKQTAPNHLTASPQTLQRQPDNEDEIQPKRETHSIIQRDQNPHQLASKSSSGLIQRDDKETEDVETQTQQTIPPNRPLPSLPTQNTQVDDKETKDVATPSTSLNSTQTQQIIPPPPNQPLPPLPAQNTQVRDRRGAVSEPKEHLSKEKQVGIWATDTLKLGGRGMDFTNASIESVSLASVLKDINGNASKLESAVEGENWLNGSQILQKIGQSFVSLGKLEGFGPIGTLLSSLSLVKYITSCIDTTKQRNLLKTKATVMGIDFNSETDPKEQIQNKVGQIDTDLADAFVHGYRKLTRRIPRLFARIVNSVISLSTLLLDLISGGMTLLVTQSIRTLSGVLIALDSLSRVFKGMWKKYKKTKGKHRLKSAQTLMEQARDGNIDAAEVVINLLKSFSADDEYSALKLTGGDTKRAMLDFFGASARMTPQQCTEELQKMDDQSYDWMTENLFAKLRSYV